jgi:hypothetical protein
MMEYPIARTFEAITNIKFGNLVRTNAPLTPRTDEDSRAFQAFCQMWSQMWGCVHFNVNPTDQTIHQEDTYVR